MTTAMNSAVSSPPVNDDELRATVAELFSVFQRLFGHRWKATFDDSKSRPAWFAVLRKAGCTPAAVRDGMARAAMLAWPPTCGEFVDLCRADEPPVDLAIIEAIRWANGQVFEWTHPAVGAAAKSIGAWSMKTSNDRDLRARFASVYAKMIDRHRCGEQLSVPYMQALPRELRTTTPAGQPAPRAVQAEIDRIADLLRVGHD